MIFNKPNYLWILATILLAGTTVARIHAQETPPALTGETQQSPEQSEIPRPEGETPDAVPAPPKEEAVPAPQENPSLTLLEESLHGNFQNLETHLKNGADPNTPTWEKIPSETLSQQENIPRPLKNLLSSDTGITPLMAAAAYGNPQACRLLIGAKANRWSRTARWKTNALGLAGDTDQLEAMREILLVPEDDPARKTIINISLSEQTGTLEIEGKEILSFEVSTARKGKVTPKGAYIITEKDVNHISTIYHVAMPFFMRLSDKDFGIHQGRLPGYPASGGCIRTSAKAAKFLFDKVRPGSMVNIH